MTEENKRQNIADEVAKADREYQAGLTLTAAGSPDIAMARAYYAMLHMARALLLSEGLEARSHSGVIHLIHAHFVRSGRLQAETAHFLTTLEADRLKADYDVAVIFTEKMAKRAMEQARQFMDVCQALLKTTGYL